MEIFRLDWSILSKIHATHLDFQTLPENCTAVVWSVSPVVLNSWMSFQAFWPVELKDGRISHLIKNTSGNLEVHYKVSTNAKIMTGSTEIITLHLATLLQKQHEHLWWERLWWNLLHRLC